MSWYRAPNALQQLLDHMSALGPIAYSLNVQISKDASHTFTQVAMGCRSVGSDFMCIDVW
jgi:hypothetical protein